ncbi:MAG: PmeII family type II restriction endonuclease [Planctomycetota bacterium]|jgi:hypothetical protein|nr:PmeII family type II restriction endonuclease [Planctomycetota bacterium]MDP7253450.1 PmeII family type II restriction endonuclease [Planctomycetota bacterium]
MAELKIDEVQQYVEGNLGEFHSTRLKRLQSLKLSKILQRKNPYLFRAKNIQSARDLVATLLDAHLSSQEETIFGEFLEGLAIFVNSKVYGGRKSSAQGIDLEFSHNKIRYIVSIKSGPNWGNSSQIRKMREDFKKARKTLRTNNSGLHIVAVNGCCYGRCSNPDKGDYFKYCGEKFWHFISGEAELFTELVESLGHVATEQNETFDRRYATIVDQFSQSFAKHFCEDGQINWEALVHYNSCAEPPDRDLDSSLDGKE